MTRGSFSIEAMLVARTVPETLKDGSTTICSIWLCPPLAHDCLLRVYPLRLEHKIKAWDVCRLFLTRSERDSREYTYKLAAAPVLIRHGNRQEVRPLVEQLAGINGGVTVKRLDDQRKSMGVIAPDLYKYVVKRVRGEQRPGLIFEDADGSHNLQIKEWGRRRRAGAAHRRAISRASSVPGRGQPARPPQDLGDRSRARLLDRADSPVASARPRRSPRRHFRARRVLPGVRDRRGPVDRPPDSA